MAKLLTFWNLLLKWNLHLGPIPVKQIRESAVDLLPLSQCSFLEWIQSEHWKSEHGNSSAYLKNVQRLSVVTFPLSDLLRADPNCLQDPLVDSGWMRRLQWEYQAWGGNKSRMGCQSIVGIQSWLYSPGLDLGWWFLQDGVLAVYFFEHFEMNGSDWHFCLYCTQYYSVVGTMSITFIIMESIK